MSSDFDPQLLVHAMAANALPGLFKESFVAAHPDYISANGYGSGYANVLREMEERQFNKARKSAVSSDAAKAAATITGMYIMAAKVAGKNLTKEEIASVNEVATKRGANLETYISLARSMGFTEAAMNALRRMFYGEKGSTAHLFDSVYNTMRSKVGAGSALGLAKQLSETRYGKFYSGEMSGNMNADDFAETFSMLSSSGAFAGANLAGGMREGFALIDDRGITNALYDPMLKGKDLAGRMGAYLTDRMTGTNLNARNYRRAISMMTDQYTDYLAGQEFNAREESLDDVFTTLEAENNPLKDAKTAMNRVNKLNENLKKIKEKYRVSVDTTQKNVDEGVKDLEKQFKEKIAEAKKNKDTEAEKQLNESKDAIIESYRDAMKETEIKTTGGESLNSFEVVGSKTVNKELAKKAIAKAESEYTAIVGDIEYLKKRRYELKTGTGEPRKPGETVESVEAELRVAEQKLDRFRDTSKANDIVYNAHGSATLQHKTAAVNDMAKSIEKAFAAAGKKIDHAEALQATKGIVPLNATAEQIRAMSDVLKDRAYGVISRGGSPEQMLLQLNSGMSIAKAYGIQGLEGMMVSDVGLLSNATSARLNMSDKEARVVADELTKENAQRARYGRIAVLAAGMLREANSESGPGFDNTQLGKALKKLEESDPDSHKRIMDALQASEQGRATDEQLRLISTFAQQNQLWDRYEENSGSTLMNRYLPQTKDVYERTLNNSVERANLHRVASRLNLSGTIGIGGDRGDEVARFLLEQGDKFNEIMTSNGSDLERGSALAELIRTSNLDPETKNELLAGLESTDAAERKKALNKFTSLNTRIQRDGGEWFRTERGKYMANKEAEMNQRNDAIERGMASLFSETDKAGLSNVLEVASSREFAKADNDKKTQMLGAAYMTQLTDFQKNAVAWDLVRSGRLAQGKYSVKTGEFDENGKAKTEEINLSASDIELAKKMLNDPKYKRALDAAKKRGDTTVTIDGKQYEVAAVTETMRNVMRVSNANVGNIGLSNEELDNMVDFDYFRKLTSDENIARNEREQEHYRELKRRKGMVAEGKVEDDLYRSSGSFNEEYQKLAEKKKNNPESFTKEDQERMDTIEAQQEKLVVKDQMYIEDELNKGKTLDEIDVSKLQSDRFKQATAIDTSTEEGRAMQEDQEYMKQMVSSGKAVDASKLKSQRAKEAAQISADQEVLKSKLKDGKLEGVKVDELQSEKAKEAARVSADQQKIKEWVAKHPGRPLSEYDGPLESKQFKDAQADKSGGGLSQVISSDGQKLLKGGGLDDFVTKDGNVKIGGGLEDVVNEKGEFKVAQKGQLGKTVDENGNLKKDNTAEENHEKAKQMQERAQAHYAEYKNKSWWNISWMWDSRGNYKNMTTEDWEKALGPNATPEQKKQLAQLEEHDKAQAEQDKKNAEKRDKLIEQNATTDPAVAAASKTNDLLEAMNNNLCTILTSISKSEHPTRTAG